MQRKLSAQRCTGAHVRKLTGGLPPISYSSARPTVVNLSTKKPSDTHVRPFFTDLDFELAPRIITKRDIVPQIEEKLRHIQDVTGVKLASNTRGAFNISDFNPPLDDISQPDLLQNTPKNVVPRVIESPSQDQSAASLHDVLPTNNKQSRTLRATWGLVLIICPRMPHVWWSPTITVYDFCLNTFTV